MLCAGGPFTYTFSSHTHAFFDEVQGAYLHVRMCELVVGILILLG